MITDMKKQIHLIIAGRSYPVQIDPAEETPLMEVVAEVNRRVDEFQRMHPAQDKQDVMAMAMLTFASDLHRARHTGEMAAMQESMAQKIAQVDQILASMLD